MQQLLALETNLFLCGHGFYDQHRDMRLDIDNMSYEVCEAYTFSIVSSICLMTILYYYLCPLKIFLCAYGSIFLERISFTCY